MEIKTYIVGDFQVNCYLVADKTSLQCAVIDAGGVSHELDGYIDSNNYTVKYIIFTHGHFDHIGGAEYYHKKYPKAKILIHSADSDCLTDETANFTYPAPYKFVPVKPDVLLKDGDVIRFGSVSLRVIHTPGHTPGGISLYSDGVLFSGDTLFFRSVGRTDFPGGSFETLKQSVRKLYKLPDNTVVYTGHGCRTSLSEEKFENPYVRVE